MKHIAMLAVLLSSVGIAGAVTNEFQTAAESKIQQMKAEIARMQNEMQKQIQENVQNDVAPIKTGTRIVTGMGKGTGWHAAIILGSDGRDEAKKKAVEDAYQKCNKLGGHLADNVFSKDMFDDFWNNSGEHNPECSGWNLIAGGKYTCTAWIKLTCTVD